MTTPPPPSGPPAPPEPGAPVPEWLQQATQGTYAGSPAPQEPQAAQAPPEPPGFAAPAGESRPEPAPRGYLAETYPADGYGATGEDPPAPWAMRPPPGAPGYGQAPYGTPGYDPQAQAPYGRGYSGPLPYGTGAYGWVPPPPPIDGMAITSLIVGVVGILTCIGVFLGPVALGLGIAALNRISQRGTRGRGLAIGGITVGAVATVVVIILIIGVATDPQGFLR
ncbi:DUF4190 domain-containing protein [Actinotalea sp. JY-7876]|uniref:DUF4190 domain-containing protein n=1 Tax=Actinotalea sp. JY-7876 TaxID=2758442 RepID=UPI0015F502C0|nr:DUF4190 domain-containing protein [Actinotalea sp. JY-7876]